MIGERLKVKGYGQRRKIGRIHYLHYQRGMMREICREGRVFCQSVMLVGLIGNTVRCRWPAVYQTYHAICFILGPTSP